MSTQLIRISDENNPFFPLPRDYPELSNEGKRQARVNASRQWLLPDGDFQRGENRVVSTHFFDSYYLQPDTDAEFDPMFYDMAPLPTPSMHWDLSRVWATNRLNACLAPRGSAKSTHCRKDMILALITTPYSFVYATSTHDNTKHTGQLIKDQCYENKRIQDDFAPEYKLTTLKPARGARPTGTEYFYLNNSSWLRCVSAESRLRGLRPRRFRLDDPEYDEKATTSMATIRAYMDRLLFKVVIPMVMRSNCGADWFGTFVSKLHYLYHAMQSIQTPEGVRAQDPRFNHWARMQIRACYEDPATGLIHSCWPEMWPVNAADRIARGLPDDTIDLEKMRELLGTSNFNGEMMGRPGTSDEQFFKFDPQANGKHAYWFEEVDEHLALNPWGSTTRICWKHPDGHTDRVRLCEWLTTVKLFMTVDTAYTENTSSDRRAVHLQAITRDNELFSLDLWADRKGDDILLRKSFEIAQRWRCPTIFVEVVKESYKLYRRFQSVVQTKMAEEMGFKHIPGVKDIKPGQMPKTAKISTLDLRFEHGLIKLPIWRRFEQPWWGRLFDQIEGFNPEADNGGLEKDDELDTLSMSLFVIRGKMKKEQREKPRVIDPIEELKAGRTTLPGGAPIGMGLDIGRLDPELIGHLLHRDVQKKEQDHAKRSRTRV